MMMADCCLWNIEESFLCNTRLSRQVAKAIVLAISPTIGMSFTPTGQAIVAKRRSDTIPDRNLTICSGNSTYAILLCGGFLLLAFILFFVDEKNRLSKGTLFGGNHGLSGI